MQRHFEQELESLKINLIKLASLAEISIESSIKSLMEKNTKLAEQVIANDQRINEIEIEIDHSIMDLMALQQPVAVDLRFILAAQKINNDLERIGDHAVNIAQSSIALANSKIHEPLLELPQMCSIVKSMLKSSIDGFIHKNPELAFSVLELDNQIDNLNKEMTTEVLHLMKSNSEMIDGGLHLLRISRNLERVADLSTNIAEEVIFVSQAKIVKHNSIDLLTKK